MRPQELDVTFSIVVLDQMAVNHVFNNLASVTAVSQPILKATTSVPSAVEKKN
jgi:hypothetical protein